MQSGDSLEKIGKRYGLSAADMERINRMPRSSELKAGQTIVAYQTMSSLERTHAIRKLLAGESLDAEPKLVEESASSEPFGPPMIKEGKPSEPFGPPSPTMMQASSPAPAQGLPRLDPIRAPKLLMTESGQ